MFKFRRTMTEISKAIATNNAKKPTKEQITELFDVLEEQGLTDSNFKVPYTKILAINPHPNADRLLLATVYGFQVVIPKDRFKVDDRIIYVPVDSILDPKLENLLFSSNSKIKLHNQRVRQIRIRGFPSQGMIIHPDEICSLVNPDYFTSEQDVSSILGVTKYEPPVRGNPHTVGKDKQRKKLAHPDFHSYNGLTNLKWQPYLFKEGEEVVIQEKLHGTNARAARLPFRANTLMKKIKQFFGYAPKVEELYGSNRVDITNASNYKGYYEDNIYGKVFEKIDVFNKIPDNITIFGEIIGPGIQKGYNYSLKEHTFVLFDVKVLHHDGTQYWYNPSQVEEFAAKQGFLFVPVLYTGPFNLALIEQLVSGPSIFDPNEKVREGICIKAASDYSIEGNKKALKSINPEYLDDNTNTDNH